jgi:predicted DNA-binding transcriptional regulator AlpA
MHPDANSAIVLGEKTRASRISVSPWVNEPLLDLREILSSHDIARLTRRPRWVLCGLALMGKFPRKKRYRGRMVGWCRTEVLEWMTRDLAVETENDERLNAPRRCARRRPRQACLPLDCAAPCARSNRSSGQRSPREKIGILRFD